MGTTLRPHVPLSEKLLLTAPEAAALLGIEYNRVLRLIQLGPHRGGLASVPIGTHRRIPRVELDKWLELNTGGPSC